MNQQDNQDGSGNDTAFTGPMHSRTPGRDIFGPLDDELPKVRVPAEVVLDARRMANSLGLDLTAYLRLNLYRALYGIDHVVMLHKKQLEGVAGNAPREGASLQPGAPIPGFLKAASK